MKANFCFALLIAMMCICPNVLAAKARSPLAVTLTATTDVSPASTRQSAQSPRDELGVYYFQVRILSVLEGETLILEISLPEGASLVEGASVLRMSSEQANAAPLDYRVKFEESVKQRLVNATVTARTRDGHQFAHQAELQFDNAASLIGNTNGFDSKGYRIRYLDERKFSIREYEQQ